MPTGPKVPLGVFDRPAPEDVPQLASTNVGGGKAAQYAKKATELLDDASDLLDKIPIIG